MNVIVACEFSGAVREAFRARGHSALSVDLLPSEQPGWHFQGDIRTVLGAAGRSLGDGWTPDLLIAFPPCTYLCSSGCTGMVVSPAEKPKQKKLSIWCVFFWTHRFI